MRLELMTGESCGAGRTGIRAGPYAPMQWYNFPCSSLVQGIEQR